MKKILLSCVCLVVFIFSCVDNNVSDDAIMDNGKIKIGTNLYLKKIVLCNSGLRSNDIIYFVVDENDNLIISGITVNGMDGKTGKITTIFE